MAQELLCRHDVLLRLEMLSRLRVAEVVALHVQVVPFIEPLKPDGQSTRRVFCRALWEYHVSLGLVGGYLVVHNGIVVLLCEEDCPLSRLLPDKTKSAKAFAVRLRFGDLPER